MIGALGYLAYPSRMQESSTIEHNRALRVTKFDSEAKSLVVAEDIRGQGPTVAASIRLPGQLACALV